MPTSYPEDADNALNRAEELARDGDDTNRVIVAVGSAIVSALLDIAEAIRETRP